MALPARSVISILCFCVPMTVAGRAAGQAALWEGPQTGWAAHSEVRPTPGAVAMEAPGWWSVPESEAGLVEPRVFLTPVYDDAFGGPLLPSSRVLVGLEAVADGRSDAASVLGSVLGQFGPGARVVRSWAHVPGVVMIETDLRSGEAVLEGIGRASRVAGVRFCEPDALFTGRANWVPNDPNFPASWHLRNTGQQGGLAGFDIGATAAWDITTGSAAVVTVVIDVGVDAAHPDLNLAPGADFTGQNGGGAPVNTCDRHGTAVAGCISQKIDNGLGTAGIAPGTRVASARVFISRSQCDGSWTSFASYTVDAINWAASSGARITNNSNGYGFTSSAIDAAYAATRGAGTLIHFAAAGNDGTSTINYPARLGTVNGVNAWTRQGSRAAFSTFGAGLDFAAPGDQIITTDRVGNAGYNATNDVLVQGTSFATPQAAGAAALILSLYPGKTPGEVETILRTSAMDLGAAGEDIQSGFGLVRADRALIAACPADTDRDGSLGLDDFQKFLDDFGGGGGGADVDLDPGVDLEDFFAFFNSWAEGC